MEKKLTEQTKTSFPPREEVVENKKTMDWLLDDNGFELHILVAEEYN